MKGGSCQIWMRVPLSPLKKKPHVAPPPGLQPTVAATNGGDGATDEGDTWQWWNTLRGAANAEKRLYVALEVDKEEADNEVVYRWLGEPVKCLILSTRYRISRLY